MIQIRDLTFSFAETESPVLRRVNISFASGEFGLVCGPTGSGKSTLLRTLTGLVPYYSSGQLSGEISLDQIQMAGNQPHQFAHLVGYVNQQPEGAFVSETVIEELAFGMEQLGLNQDEMHARVAEYSQLLGIEDLLTQNLETLSGGQQQRVAIAAAISCGQKILLLDEPTSALDVQAADDLLVLLKSLCDSHGITVLLAEHRIERAIAMVDSVTVVHGDGSVSKAMVSEGLDPVLRDYRMVPPVIELGQQLNWQPLPLSVEQAKQAWFKKHGAVTLPKLHERLDLQPSMIACGLGVAYSGQPAVENASMRLWPGQIQALMGPNGSGKTSLLWALQGSLKHTGDVRLANGEVPSQLAPQLRIQQIAMVPQTAADLLVLSSVSAELEDSDAFAGVETGTTARRFAKLAGRIDPARHPHDLSAGQQLALVLAIQLAKGAPIVLLDEPTRGLDYQAKRNLVAQLEALAMEGKSVLFASHDVEFVALVAHEVSLIANGEITAQGSAQEILTTLGKHAPQTFQVTQKAWRVAQVTP